MLEGKSLFSLDLLYDDLMTSKTIWESIVFRVIIPMWSKEGERGKVPDTLIVPNVGFNPTTPHSEDGTLIDPPVSVPIEKTFAF